MKLIFVLLTFSVPKISSVKFPHKKNNNKINKNIIKKKWNIDLSPFFLIFTPFSDQIWNFKIKNRIWANMIQWNFVSCVILYEYCARQYVFRLLLALFISVNISPRAPDILTLICSKCTFLTGYWALKLNRTIYI